MGLYENALQEVARQINCYGTEHLFSPQVEVRLLEWDDVVKQGGVTVRYEDSFRENQEGTCQRDQYGFPCHVVIAQGWRAQLAEETVTAMDLKHWVQAYFHNRRRMSAALIPGATEEPCTVTGGPRVPARHQDKRFHVLTVWAWFLASRSDDSFPA